NRRKQVFLLVTFSADEADVEESELVEAFEEVFAHKDKVAFFVNANKDAHDEETLNQLGEKHTSTEDTDKDWQPMKHGIILVHRGEVRKQSSTALLESSNIKETIHKNNGENRTFYEFTKNLDSEITYILDFMKKNDIRLHY